MLTPGPGRDAGAVLVVAPAAELDVAECPPDAHAAVTRPRMQESLFMRPFAGVTTTDSIGCLYCW